MEAKIGQKLQDERGFTMPELITAMTVMLLVLGTALTLFQVVLRNQPEVTDRNAKIQAAQISMERMIRDLRQSYAVVGATPSQLTVLTFDNRTSCGSAALGTARRCRVTYSCTAGTCRRTASEATDPTGATAGAAVIAVTDLASNNVFSYSPSSGTPSMVSVQFIIPVTPGSSEDAITLRDGVALRNLGGPS